MESSNLVIFLTSGKFITKLNVLRCISLSETLFWTVARGRIPITSIDCFVNAEKYSAFWEELKLGFIPKEFNMTSFF